jgi:hypothetical protein
VTTATIAVVVGLLGVGLAVSQLLRLRTWLSRPQAEEPTETDPADPPA